MQRQSLQEHFVNDTGQGNAILAEVSRLVRQVDPSAFVVEPRVVRRVICEDHDLSQFAFSVPHAQICVIPSGRMRRIVHPDELGLMSVAAFPERVILLAGPSDKQLKTMTREQLLLRTWRLLFHARIDFALQEQRSNGTLTDADIRERIDQIGQVEFDEIQSTLYRESLLFSADDRSATYAEFIAIFYELYRFAPDWVSTWFPSIHDSHEFARLLGLDIDADELFEQSRLPGAPDPLFDRRSSFHEPTQVDKVPDSSRGAIKVNMSRHRRLMRRAGVLSQRGNSVAAAILAQRAAECADADSLPDASQRVIREIERFISRLQDALNFDRQESVDWHRAIVGLLRHSVKGFWNADKRLLYDLQKVCVDHEREIYTVDMVKWIVTMGKRPIKRPLPNQREVMMSKHLRSAAGRIVAVRLSGDDRERLAVLLRHAADSAESQMRTRLRPLVDQTFKNVDLVPTNLPERVAYAKLIEECLDSIAERGYLTMGYLRDAISRNNLKLPDVSHVSQIFKGDRLLRADDQFDGSLDGVYHRGEFYLRWLQTVSSMAFGTRTGRFATRFIAIPFGGAFLIIEGLSHLLHMFTATQTAAQAAKELAATASAPTTITEAVAASPGMERVTEILLLGFVVMAIIHLDSFRNLVIRGLRRILKGLRYIAIDLPIKLYQMPVVRRILRSTPFRILRSYVISPAAITLTSLYAIPMLFTRTHPSWTLIGTTFLLLSAAINSRLARDFKELSLEFISKHWRNIRAAVFVALIDWIFEFFKWLLNQLERVLYAVDEWLRFKSGESIVTLTVKAILGVVWSFVNFIIRFCVNLLIEPQVNPIKHFPVVTVSHKLLLPTMPVILGPVLTPLMGSVTAAQGMAVTIATMIPGIFGFLVWELKENWRLYEANRAKHLQPVIVGGHGETLLKLMKPGFHSGTLPKLFRKLRRLERQAVSFRRYRSRTTLYQDLHHVQVALRHHTERELLGLLGECPGWQDRPLTVGKIDANSNSVQVELVDASSPDPLVLSFQEQSGWMVSGILKSGWLHLISDQQRDALAVALAGFYGIGSVDLVRERIENCFEKEFLAYDVTQNGLVAWPDSSYNDEVVYDLERTPVIRPMPTVLASRYQMPVVNSHELMFSETPILWKEWVAWWETQPEPTATPQLSQSCRNLLPSAQK